MTDTTPTPVAMDDDSADVLMSLARMIALSRRTLADSRHRRHAWEAERAEWWRERDARRQRDALNREIERRDGRRAYSLH